jgi:nucleoid-associated protein YgaU
VEKVVKKPEILSPPAEAELPKVLKASAATPKRRRMANVLDAVLETTKALSPALTKKIAEGAKAQAKAETGQAETEATQAPQAQAEAKAGPSAPVAAKPAAPEEETAGHIAPETPVLEAPIKTIDYIFQHASGKKLSKDEITEARHYAQKLKYPERALVLTRVMKMISCTVSRTSKRYPFARR